ncbi:MAG: cytochrome P450 [Actinobacteria bacterium]|nr:cytochrome P450 [Actinomycetota bacterium]
MVDEGSETTQDTETVREPPAPDWDLFDPKTGMVGLIPFFDSGRPVCSLPLDPAVKNYMLVSHNVIDQATNDAAFDKYVVSGLGLIRAGSPNGLFTADTDDPQWVLSHKLLMPAFATKAIKGYHDLMVDPAMQLVLKWARLNPGDEIDVTADYTRLTFETIGLVGFGYRFGAFYRENPHQFVTYMGDLLYWAIKNSTNPEASPYDPPAEVIEAVTYMNGLVDGVVDHRKQHPDHGTEKDLLDYMLGAKDEESGEGLSAEIIRSQINTFLIAGHETTSGLLSFATYYLMNNPDVLAKCYAEVDAEIGDDLSKVPTAADVVNCRYLMQVLKEVLRLWPGAPFIIRHSRGAEELLEEYPVEPADSLNISLAHLHRDPVIWGDDADSFNPDRFAPGEEEKLPPNAYLPFGVGQRACIGRQFAIAEAHLALALILQRFEFIDHADYQLSIKRGLTIKPRDFKIQIVPRPGREAAVLRAGGVEPVADESPTKAATARRDKVDVPKNGKKIVVAFGSNLGSSEGLAREMVADAARGGFETELAELDTFTDNLPTDALFVVVTSSYNGQPPDNAKAFCEWLGNLESPDALAGVRYSVFGCGDRNWASTYQAIPALIDAGLAAHGAERVVDLGAADASDDFDGQFRSWYGPALTQFYTASGLDPIELDEGGDRLIMEIGTPLRQRFFKTLNAVPVRMESKEELQGKSTDGTPDRSTLLIDLELPEGVTYETGDRLAVLPFNTAETISRTLGYFTSAPETIVSLHADGPTDTVLPLDQPHTLSTLLNFYSELQLPATRAQIDTLVEYATAPRDRRRLSSLTGEDKDSQEAYREFVLEARRSVIDLLEENPSCCPPDEVLLDLLGELKPRFYSIASSPSVDPRTVSLMVNVMEAPSLSGHGTYRGTCSTFLARQPIGQRLHASVRAPGMPFRPPDNPEVPMIMIATGSGLAPFRGFLQERAQDASRGRVGTSMLFFGCRNSGADFLMGKDLEQYDEDGVVQLVTAFSDEPGRRRKFVQNRIWDKRHEVWDLMEKGANVYVCGHAGRVAPAARKVFEDLYRDQTGADEEAAQQWVQSLRDDNRYLEDIWAG